MPLTEQADDIARSIHDHGEEVGDVATEDAHVERFQFRQGSILAAEHDFALILLREPNGRFDDDRGSLATHTTEFVQRTPLRYSKGVQDILTEDGAIRGRIHTKAQRD